MNICYFFKVVPMEKVGSEYQAVVVSLVFLIIIIPFLNLFIIVAGLLLARVF